MYLDPGRSERVSALQCTFRQHSATVCYQCLQRSARSDSSPHTTATKPSTPYNDRKLVWTLEPSPIVVRRRSLCQLYEEAADGMDLSILRQASEIQLSSTLYLSTYLRICDTFSSPSETTFRPSHQDCYQSVKLVGQCTGRLPYVNMPQH
jgi:hypothetical protein